MVVVFVIVIDQILFVFVVLIHSWELLSVLSPAITIIPVIFICIALYLNFIRDRFW